MSATCVKFYNNGLFDLAARAGLFWMYFDYFEQELDDFGRL